MSAKFDLSTLPACPDLRYERELWAGGLLRVAGIDEAGRGPLAGPVTAAAVILPPDPTVAEILWGVRDSKQMTAPEREHWAAWIQGTALGWGVGFASHIEIDELGIVPATLLAAQRALDCLPDPPEHLLLDFICLPENHLPQTSLVKGDCRSLSIAAASVLAKTARDRVMIELDREYPGYGFANNKGYASRGHLRALSECGACAIHRRSFHPVRDEALRIRD